MYGVWLLWPIVCVCMYAYWNFFLVSFVVYAFVRKLFFFLLRLYIYICRTVNKNPRTSVSLSLFLSLVCTLSENVNVHVIKPRKTANYNGRKSLEMNWWKWLLPANIQYAHKIFANYIYKEIEIERDQIKRKKPLWPFNRDRLQCENSRKPTLTNNNNNINNKSKCVVVRFTHTFIWSWFFKCHTIKW